MRPLMESPNLPTEIIVEILLRLPVKILLRFKCVCKEWYTLIGSQSFINQHFGHESNQEKLLIWHEKHHAFQLKFILASYVDGMFSVYEKPETLKGLGGAEFLMGPLNGVFCVCSREKPWTKMALVNPAMRQFKPLPLLHRDYRVFRFSLLGFGLDQVSGDYKVVRINYLRNKDVSVLHCHPLVYVYNSGSNSCRHLKDVDLDHSMHSACYESDRYCTYLDGQCYWVVHLMDSNAAIIVFDLRSEKFREIRVPDYIRPPDWYLKLVLNGDSLALLSVGYQYQTGICVNVWVLQNERSWAKVLTLSSLGDVRPFGFWKKNELIIGGPTSIFALDGSKEKVWSIETPARRHYDMFFHAYKENLVSLQHEGDSCKLWDVCSDFVRDFFLQS